MKSINVLIACEESQVETIAFRKRGFSAFSCDMQECSGGHPEWHIKQDVRQVMNGKCSFLTQNGNCHHITKSWDLIIAHPPCTFLTAASAVRMYPKAGILDKNRYEKMKKARAFFYEFLEVESLFVAIENPTPLRIAELPKPTTFVQPYEFGEPFSKKTCLWLKNLPPLFPTAIMANHRCFIYSKTASIRSGGNIKFTSGAKNRSKSFLGIAEAMAAQWGDYVKTYLSRGCLG